MPSWSPGFSRLNVCRGRGLPALRYVLVCCLLRL